MPVISSAWRASRARSVPTGRPALRNTRAKCTTLSARRPAFASRPMGSVIGSTSVLPDGGGRRPADSFEDPRGLGTPDARDIVLVLQEDAERVIDGLLVERRAIEREQRAPPFDRFREARNLVEIDAAQVVNELDNLPRQGFLHVGHAQPDDLELTRRLRVIDPVVDAPTLHGVMDLTRPVGCDD